MMLRQVMFTLALIGGGALAAAPGSAHAADPVVATLMNAEGKQVGTVELQAVDTGVLLTARFSGLAPGVHAFHVHTTGQCTPPFTSAGGHYNPDGRKHGIDAAGGPHAGDMPNIHVPASGALTVEVLNTRLRLDDRLFDEDGAALVLHEGADDYHTNPAGAAGPRIACGVIKK